jgi:predicted lipoprotein with Yx(FWY)xxD motif
MPAATVLSAGAETVRAVQHPSLGRILTDGSGKTLYLFDRDMPGVSNCSGNCLQNWPPLIVESGEPRGGAGVSGKLSVLPRDDGRRHVMYNDTPLYYYAADTQPGDTRGDGVGGVWHVVKS